MEKGTIQEESEAKPIPPKAVKIRVRKQDPNVVLPLIITLIGIFCYIGMILPFVLDSTNRAFEYSLLDMLIMVGGAFLVAIGAYFWFQARIASSGPKKKKVLEPV
jgi:peptidoglycan/LPS O-acetylase OafA/YrhL